MTDRTDQPTRQPSTRHRDDTGTIVLSRPGTPGDPHPKRASAARRVTARTITQARAVLADAERRITRARGKNRWLLTMRIDGARAVLRAAGGVA